MNGMIALYLDAFKDTFFTMKGDKKCIAIPIEDNNFYRTESGRIVASLYINALRPPWNGYEFCLRRKLTPLEQELSLSARKAISIVGLFKPEETDEVAQARKELEKAKRGGRKKGKGTRKKNILTSKSVKPSYQEFTGDPLFQDARIDKTMENDKKYKRNFDDILSIDEIPL